MSAAAYLADGRPCTRDEFYSLACDPARSVVVEACAGAGKTWILVSRILRALLDGASPSEVLAITFTRKAAGEMRARLHEWLREVAVASPGERVKALVDRGLAPPSAQRLEPALARLHARVLATGEVAQISTFHAWFAQLLRIAPLEVLDALGLHSSMSLIEEIDDQKPDLMLRFNQVVLDTPALLRDYVALTERHGPSKLADWLNAALSRRIEVEFADAAKALEPAIGPASLHWADCAGLAHPHERIRSDLVLRGVLADAAGALVAQKGKLARNAGSNLTRALEQGNAQPAFLLARDALFTKDGSTRKLGELPAVYAAAQALQLLQDQAAQQDAHDDHQRMTRLTRALLQQWGDLKRERGLVDMPDLERCALAVLSNSTLSGWIQERLDARVRHLLIDEFQDTSPLQWHALQGWLSSYAGAGGGASGQRPLSVFIVGDPKQSIYRFRRAEPRVFSAARDFVVLGLEGHALECHHTLRCAPRVLDCVNAVFLAAKAHGDYPGFRAHSTGADVQTPGRSLRLMDAVPPSDMPAGDQAGDGWRDSLTIPRTTPKEPRSLDEARRVARAAQAMIVNGECRAGDIMILARRRATLALVVDELRALALDCVAAEALRLADLAEVRDLVALLDALASNGHDLSLAHALKSPLFGASDDDLLALSGRASSISGPARWWAALQSWDGAPAGLARARRLLASWAALARSVPPHDLLDRIVDQGDLKARLAGAVPPQRRGVALAAVDALLALSLSLDSGRYATVYRFVRALRQRALSVPAPTREEAIKLMTIHGAKGLQARCVFVVDSDANPGHEARPAVLVDWPVEARAPRCVAFVVNGRRVPPSLIGLHAAEAAANAHEELNALYVAMTRAIDTLVFSRTVPRSAAVAPSWWSRVYDATVELGLVAIESPVPPVAASQAMVPELSRPAMSSAAIEQADQETADDDEARRLGQAVHRTLQWHGQPGAPASDVRALAVSAAREFGLTGAVARRVVEIVSAMLESPKLAALFDPGRVLWAANEIEVALAGDVLRIDRLVQIGPVETPVWWVLDYKLDANAIVNPELRRQLARYRDAVRSLVGPAPVHAAFATRDGELHELN